jgi:Linear amide C-N hydrolases, choloylglycine hydrolase family
MVPAWSFAHCLSCSTAILAVLRQKLHLCRCPNSSGHLYWKFPKLGENLIVAHQSGGAKDFYNITGPGVSGMFQGLAPGRFSASLNQAPMRRHGLTYFGNWVKNRKSVFQTGGLPPAHLLRKVFEEAKNYEDAKERLARTPVALPVIYILAGIRKGEGCVIERTENDCAIRAIENDRVCASNQFETRLNFIGRGWRPRPLNSAGRADQARTLPLVTIDDQFGWFKPPIANSHTRLVMMACAVTGKLHVFGTQGQKPVTEMFRLQS